MSDTLLLFLALLAGASLGLIFFGGLWWTVRRGIVSKQPALWFFSSLLLRTAIAVTGFYFVMHGDWRRLLACFFGFFLARICVLRLTRAKIEDGNRIAEEGAA